MMPVTRPNREHSALATFVSRPGAEAAAGGTYPPAVAFGFGFGFAVAPPSAAPQFGQNAPVAWVPQFGQNAIDASSSAKRSYECSANRAKLLGRNRTPHRRT